MNLRHTFTDLSLVAMAALVGLGCPYYGGNGGGGYGDDDDAGGDGGCVDSFECDDLEFCNVGECDSALDRRYRVSVLDGEALTTGPDGSWDVGGGAPDLYVQFGMRDSSNDEWVDECFTETVQDSFDPSWNVYCEFVFESGGTFAIWAWDEDLTASDFAGGGYWQGNDALVAVIRGNGLTSSTDIGGSLSVRWVIEPTF